MREEEGHPIAGESARIQTDVEGEGGDEARRLAGRCVPERHWLRVRRPADTVGAALVTLVPRELEGVWTEVGVAGEGYELGEVWALGHGEGEVEGHRASARDMDGKRPKTVEAAQDGEAGGTAARSSCGCHCC